MALDERTPCRISRELKVWEKAHEMTLEVYTASQGFPKGRSLWADQPDTPLQRLDPHQHRRRLRPRHPPDFAHYLQIAMGSASELEYQLILAKDLNYLPSGKYDELSARVTEIKRMLSGLNRKLNSFN
jgi:hypothetical protein